MQNPVYKEPLELNNKKKTEKKMDKVLELVFLQQKHRNSPQAHKTPTQNGYLKRSHDNVNASQLNVLHRNERKGSCKITKSSFHMRN